MGNDKERDALASRVANARKAHSDAVKAYQRYMDEHAGVRVGEMVRATGGAWKGLEGKVSKVQALGFSTFVSMYVKRADGEWGKKHHALYNNWEKVDAS